MSEIIEIGIITLAFILLVKLLNSSNCKKETADMTNENTTTQPASIDGLTVAANSAKVTIEYGDVSEIVIKANNPEEFDITNLADVLTIKEKPSSQASVVGGIISGNRGCSVVCNGSISGLSQSVIGGKQIVRVNGLTITSSTGCQIRINNDSISINGQVIKSPPYGSTIEVRADGIYVNGKVVQQSAATASAKPKARNELHITVPRDCQSTLILIGNSTAEFFLSAWSNPKELKIMLFSDAKLTAGTIACRLVEASLSSDASSSFDEIVAEGADLSASSDGRMTINHLSSSALDIRTSSDAQVVIKAGGTKSGTARASSDSIIRLRGNFDNVRSQKNSDAVIDIRKS